MLWSLDLGGNAKGPPFARRSALQPWPGTAVAPTGPWPGQPWLPELSSRLCGAAEGQCLARPWSAPRHRAAVVHLTSAWPQGIAHWKAQHTSRVSESCRVSESHAARPGHRNTGTPVLGDRQGQCSSPASDPPKPPKPLLQRRKPDNWAPWTGRDTESQSAMGQSTMATSGPEAGIQRKGWRAHVQVCLDV